MLVINHAGINSYASEPQTVVNELIFNFLINSLLIFSDCTLEVQ